MRVVCEFCQTVYNIPEAKITREVSQATCKVCRNRILIRRDITAGPFPRGVAPVSPLAANTEPAAPRQPGPSGSTPGPGTSPLASPPETELSDSWREAIVDNSRTVQMLKDMGVVEAGSGVTPLPETNGKDPSPGDEHPGAAGAPVNAASLSAVRRGAMSTVPRPPPDPGPSPLLSGIAAALAALQVLALVRHGAWASGTAGLMALGIAAFVATACLLNALVKKRSPLALLVLLLIATGAGGGTIMGVLLLGGPPARSFIASHPSLARLFSHPPP